MNKYLKKIGLKFLPLLINLLIKTLRIKIHNKPSDDKNYIFIFWHSQMLLGWWLFKNRRAAALVSKSKDGDILNRVLLNWNYKVIRGSSSKGGKEAINDIAEFVNKNNSAVLTPDGPRGPAKEIKNGALIISNRCGLPVIPVKIIYQRKKVLSKSWDKFEIPLPFSKCEVYFGKEFIYDKFLPENELSELKKEISNEL